MPKYGVCKVQHDVFVSSQGKGKFGALDLVGRECCCRLNELRSRTFFIYFGGDGLGHWLGRVCLGRGKREEEKGTASHTTDWGRKSKAMLHVKRQIEYHRFGMKRLDGGRYPVSRVLPNYNLQPPSVSDLSDFVVSQYLQYARCT